MAYLPMLFSARRCTTIRSGSQATPTIIIGCGFFLGAALILLEHGICAAFIGGQRLFEEIQYVVLGIPLQSPDH